MAEYIYEPNISYTKGSPKQISTRGFVPDRTSLGVSTEGFIVPQFVETNIIFGGSAEISARINYITVGGIILDVGISSPVVSVIGGQSVYEYPSTGELNLGGCAPFAVEKAGVLEFVYDADPQPIIFDGDADIIFQPRTKEDRGGRGILRKPRIRQPNVFFYEVSVYREDTLWGNERFSGEADCEFNPFERYKFIKTLPKKEKEKDISVSFIKSLLDKTPVIFDYKSTGEQEYNRKIAKPLSNYEYKDYNKFLRKLDNEFIEDYALIDESNINFIVTYDKNLNNLKKDDDFIITHLL